MKKRMVWILVLCAAVLLCACKKDEIRVEPAPTTAATEPAPPTTEATEVTEPPTTAPTEPPEEHFWLTFVGDCTLGSDPATYGMPNGFINVVGDDYGYPFRNVAEFFENDEFTMINLEGVFADEGVPAGKLFTFRGPSEYIRILTENSVEAVTLSNNHTLDYHQAGYDSTKALLDGAGIPYVERNSSRLLTTQNGLTIGLYAATFTVDMKDLEAEVAAMREQGAEVVIFAAHWGKEGYYYPLTHLEQYAYDAIDAGVDIVYGHHPHVLQRMEEYNGGVIFFSLGNFSFGGNLQPADMDSVLMQQEYIRDAEGNLRKGELKVVPMSITSELPFNNFQPTPYEEGSEGYLRVMEKLSGAWYGRRIAVNY